MVSTGKKKITQLDSKVIGTFVEEIEGRYWRQAVQDGTDLE